MQKIDRVSAKENGSCLELTWSVVSIISLIFNPLYIVWSSIRKYIIYIKIEWLDSAFAVWAIFQQYNGGTYKEVTVAGKGLRNWDQCLAPTVFWTFTLEF